MLTLTEIAWFALASLLLALTPGPNMIYCVSRTLIQGRRAGMVSLGGVLMAFLVHLFAAALGLTALLLGGAARVRCDPHRRRGLPAVARVAGGAARRQCALRGARAAGRSAGQAVPHGAFSRTC
jgi:hypothetical protein